MGIPPVPTDSTQSRQHRTQIATALNAALKVIANTPYTIINPLDYGIVADPSKDNVQGLARLKTYLTSQTRPLKVVYPGGQYSSSSWPNWAQSNLVIDFDGDVEWINTGTGHTVILDGGTNVAVGIINMKFGESGRLIVKGGAGSKDGIFVRNCHHGKINGTVIGAGTTYAGFRDQFNVCTEFNVKVSNNEAPGSAWYSQPTNGYIHDRMDTSIAVSGSNPPSSACIYQNPVVEGVSGDGIKPIYLIGGRYIGGTSETCGGWGVNMQLGSFSQWLARNKFDSMDIEGNTLGSIITDATSCTFENLISAGLIHFATGATRNRLSGGLLDGVLIDFNCLDNIVEDLSTGAVGGVLTDNSLSTVISNVYDGANAKFYRDRRPNAGLALAEFDVPYSASMTIDASNGDTFVVPVTNGTAMTMNAPINPTNGQEIEIQMRNYSGVAMGAVTWNAVFHLAGAWVNPTGTGAVQRSITFKYTSGSGVWYEKSRNVADVNI